MKITVRILVILAVAVAVAGAALVLVNVTGLEAAQASSGQQFHSGRGLGSGRFATTSGLDGSRAGHGGDGGGSLSMTETIKNFGIVAVMTAVVVAFERLLKLIRKNRLARQPAGRGQSGRKE